MHKRNAKKRLANIKKDYKHVFTFLSRRLKRMTNHCTKPNREDVTRVKSTPIIKCSFPSIKCYINTIIVYRA